MTLRRHTFGSDEGAVILVDILNARDKSTRRKICRSISAFRRKLNATRDIKEKRMRQYFSQLLYSTYKQLIIDKHHEDVELKNFTLNLLCAMYRDYYRDHL